MKQKKAQVASMLSMIFVYLTIFVLVIIFFVAVLWTKTKSDFSGINPEISIAGGKGNLLLLNQLASFLDLKLENGESVKEAIKRWSLDGDEELGKKIENKFIEFRDWNNAECFRLDVKKRDYYLLSVNGLPYTGAVLEGRSLQIISRDSPEYWTSLKILNSKEEIVDIKFYLGVCNVS